MIRSSAAPALGGTEGNAKPRTMPVVTNPATRDATAYFHTASINEVTRNAIGRPAYQKAGIKRVQKDTLHATAIPSGPQCRATIKSKAVTTNSRMLQRSQRSGLPIERLTQPMVL